MASAKDQRCCGTKWLACCQERSSGANFWTTLCSVNLWRWGIQAMCCAAITSILSTVPTFHQLFRGSGVWAVQTAIAVLEGTAGASVKKSAERIVGTVAGGLGAYLFVLVTLGEHVETGFVAILILLAFFVLSPLFWGWIRVKFPNNVLIGVYGLLTSNLIAGGAYVGSGAFQPAMFRILAVVLGVLVNTLVVHLVLPNRARDQLVTKCKALLTAMSEILEPIVELEAGLEPLNTGKIVKPNKETLREIACRRRQLIAERRKRRQQKRLVAQSSATTLRDDTRGPELTSPSDSKTRKESFLNVMVRTLSASTDAWKQAPTEGKTGPMGSTSSNVHHDDDPEFLQFQQAQQRHDSTLTPMGSTRRTSVTVSPRDGSNAALDHEPSIFRTLSNVSQASTFYRQQVIELELLKGKTFQELAVEYAREVNVAESRRQERWSATMQTVETCQQHLSALPALLIAARQELRLCHGPAVFPTKQYQQLVSQIQRLFHQIASLFFAVDCQLAQVSRAKLESLLALKSAHTENAPTFSRFAFSAFEGGTLPTDPQMMRKIFAGIAGAFLFTEVFGAIIGRAVGHIQEALTELARAFSDEEAASLALDAISDAAEDISLLCSIRNERSQIYANIFEAALTADAMGHWVRPKLPSGTLGGNAEPGQSYTSIPWEKLMGLDAETFQDMSKAEHQVYWESYWRARDRLSVTTGTLMALRDQLYVIRTTIDTIVSTADDNHYIRVV